MNLGDMISNSIKFPFSDMKRFLGLCLLYLSSITIFLFPLSMGYALRIIEATTQGKNELPEFVEWGRMYVDGLKLLLTSIIYFLIPAILIILSMVMITISTSSIVLLIVGILVLIIINLIYVSAVNNMAYEKKLEAAFDFKKILGLIKNMGWLNYFIYLFLSGIVAYIISKISDVLFSSLLFFGLTGVLIGILILILSSSYLLIYQYRFFGLLYCHMKTELSPENEIIEKNEPEGGSEI